jgi:hypothetical protein
MKNVDNRVNRAYHIIGDGVVVFVFSDFGGYRPPKGEEGDEIFNMNHKGAKAIIHHSYMFIFHWVDTSVPPYQW